MKTLRPPLAWPSLLAATLGLLSACGGSGDGDTPAPAPATPPASGNYGWVLKAEGATSRLKFGLSLLHPAQPDVEWVIETASDAVTDTKLVASGNVDPATANVSALQPYTLVYIVGGDVRRVPLVANGQAPKPQVQRAQSTSACAFVIDAIDHATPERSRFIVSTAGADGLCDTADDGRAEVRLQAAAPGIVFTPLAGTLPLAALRDPATLAPRGWVFASEVRPWAAGSAAFTFRASDPITRLVDSSPRTLLAESANGLALLDFPGGSSFTDTPLSGASGSGWQAIGHDAQYHYAYRNSGDSSGSWTVIRVARSAPLATTLASGSGQISVASLGKDQLYLTVFTPAANRLLRLPKAVPGATPQVLDDATATTLATVVTSSSDVHQLWRITGVGSATPGYTLQMIDESGATLFTSSGGGFPLLLAGGSALNLDVTENRGRFVFADHYGSRAYADATLTSFDATTRQLTAVGTLPGNAQYGNDFVFAGVNGGTGAYMTGFAARSVGGVVQGAAAQVFSFDATSASSLKTARSVQP